MAFTPSKAKKNPPKRAEMPNLTSMMDMMTIILLFLLKSLSVSGALLHPAPGIELPLSEIHVQAQKNLSFIIYIHEVDNYPPGLYEQTPEGIRGVYLATKEELYDDSQIIFNQLKNYLERERALDLDLKRPLRDIVTLQGDKSVQYRHLSKFIQTCGEAGFSTIQFIVEKEG